MKKYIVIAFVLLLLLALVACGQENAVLGTTQVYDVTSDIQSLEIRLNAADFQIEHAAEFSVESNLKYLSVSEKDGVLTIIDRAPGDGNYSNARLTLYIPSETVFENVDIETGAAKLTADALSAKALELELGAGDVRFACLNVSSYVEINGGASQLTVVDGSLNNLSLEMGVGEANLTVALLGNSDLEFGIGESNLTLLGSKDDYRVDFEKGLGVLRIDGEEVLSSSFGTGQNHIHIEGGVGEVNLAFREGSG